MLTNTALRLLRRLLGSRAEKGRPYEGSTPALLDGATAVAVTEAMVSEAAGLGAAPPLKAAELAWRNEQQYTSNQRLSPALSSLVTDGPRGAVAAALGQSLSGLRATTFISGSDLASVQDLIQTAVGHRAPLVIHLGLRGTGGVGPAPGTGHETLHAAAATGAIILVAANVQEAVDFTLIARRIAEQALIPVLVAQDGEQTALALQNLNLPALDFVERFLGRPGDQVPTPTSAQQFLFGETRRRLPRWHDADRPVLLGSPLTPELRGLSQAGASVYLDAPAEAILEKTLQEFSASGGQMHRMLSRHRLEDADLILVAQGSTIETAEVVCDQVRSQNRLLKIGILGLRCLRPLPTTEIARILDRNAKVCVLERLTTPLAGNTPLLGELSAILGSHQNSARSTRPNFISVAYGLGGMPLRASDLAHLCQVAPKLEQSQIYLGMDLAATESPYPKRKVLLDRLHRDYPTLAKQCLAPGATADLRPAGCVTLSIHRLAGGLGDGLIPETATLLQYIFKGGLRCRPGIPGGWGNACVDRISVSSNLLKDLGDCPPADLALLTADPALPDIWPIDLAKGAALVIVSELPDEALLARLPANVRSKLQQADVALYRLPTHGDALPGRDELLGGLCGVLLERSKLDITRWRLLAVQDELLGAAAIGRIDHFTTGLDAVRRIEWPTQAVTSVRISKDYDTAPESLRRAKTDNAYDSLPRFWDQVGVLYARGDTAELIPDPYLAIGTVPAKSAALRDLSGTRARLPILDTTQCSGCGACWSACPDGAWGAVLLNTTQILDAGMRNINASALRPLASKLATAVAKQCQIQQPSEPLAKLLGTAFKSMYPQLPFPEERKVSMAQELEKLVTIFSQLPLAVTNTLFRAPETKTPGQGALLALALDADACKGCAMCVTLCPTAAISLQWQDQATLAQVRQQRQVWNLLPESDSAACAKLKEQPGLAALGSALLAPGAAKAMTGGDGMEPGSGARLAIRLALAIAESKQTPIQNTWLREVSDAHGQIMELIRTLLSDTLPTDDLDSLSKRLATLGSGPADLGAILGQTEVTAATTVDSERLQRLIALSKNLADLAWRLEEGRQGQGRARTSVVLSLRDYPSWGLSYPYNPFSGPVTLDHTGDAPLLAAGILDGHLHQITTDLALLRQARLEREQPEQAARNFGHSALSWEELSREEQDKAGQLFIIGDAGLLSGRSLSQLHRLLSTSLPIKILVLANLDLGLATPAGLNFTAAAMPDTDAEISLLALAHRNIYVAQSALSIPDHLLPTLEQMLEHPGPALLQVHAPSPSYHGYPSGRTLARINDAVTCGVFQLFRYDPKRDGVFGTRFDLQGNPETTRTPAHWAMGEERFAALFSPLAENAPNPTALDAYLALDPKQRRGRSPFVERIGHDEKPQRLAVTLELARVCEERQAVWRMLQELAGVVTPFTARVREEIETKNAAAHQAELATQAANYEARISGLEDKIMEDTRHKLRIRLMELGGYAH